MEREQVRWQPRPTPEPVPAEPVVPLVRWNLDRTVKGWVRFMYPRGRFFFAWGFLFWIFLFWIAFKAVVFWSVVLLLLVAFGLWSVYDLATYPHRRKVARVRVWTRYMTEE